MKTIKNSRWLILVLLAGTLGLSCSKDDPGNGDGNGGNGLEQRNGLDESEVAADPGAIGLSVSARSLARKGYHPELAAIRIQGTHSALSAEVVIDADTQIGALSFENEDLSESERKDLSDGVPLTVEIRNANDSVLATKTFSKISFTSSPSLTPIDNEALPDKFRTVTLRPGVYYYLQLVDEDGTEIYGAPASDSYTNGTNLSTRINVRQADELDYNSEYVDLYTRFLFTEMPGQPGVYSIGLRDKDTPDNLLYMYIKVDNSRVLNIQSRANRARNGDNTDPTQPPNYAFRIEKTPNGLFTITPTEQNRPLVLSENGLYLHCAPGSENETPAYFRILAFDIDWEIQSLEYKHLQPILPPAGTSFAYNSTLVNCSSGELVQEVGVNQTRETKSVFGWEESFSLSSSQEFSVDVSMESTISAEFYGVGSSVSSSVSESYTTTRSQTNTSTQSAAFETTESIELSTRRSLTVPAKKATLVSDMYQSYENVRVPFVQRFRIKGAYQGDNSPLTGDEIITQFAFNQFSGVITEKGADYIEVTVRGTNTIDELIDTQTVARDVPSECN
ncbi:MULTISPECIES: hypothetical protein [unclassified Robiginitalea]|uniref:hypothetical protein n=1 Tax=Robiginitalea TaxID=252306 RepID=UPI00234BC6AA|nr:MULTISPECIES: hypothetical protein [unclassified Robiginitalea]MDC6353653.1 hypothetical protein [Robiginitalea sp. PM2]MDC6375727.1 hypothetical protein [Robiginitalea sp. SP8]